MPKTILIAEDQLREIMKEYLSNEGYEVLEASDGNVALALFQEQEVDLIILDIMIPELDGWSVCRQIRKTSNLPILILTTRPDEEDTLMVFELGASFDFTVRVPIETEDEVGSSSRNINELSGLLHNHIARVKQNIEQEKRLKQTLKEFIAGVSHELKTPLSVIESCLYILKDKPDSQKREYYFASMKNEVKKMNLLITDMMELAKYESGTYKPEVTSFRIDAILDRVCEKLAPEIARKRLRLHTRFVPVEVVANPLRIEQVVLNFLTNAIRYTPEGESVFMTVEQRESVKVCIENKGAYIPDDQLDKIWDSFYRVERSRHRSTGGPGLGLAISKQILELHGAPYGAENTEDGVLFWFKLNKQRQG